MLFTVSVTVVLIEVDDEEVTSDCTLSVAEATVPLLSILVDVVSGSRRFDATGMLSRPPETNASVNAGSERTS